MAREWTPEYKANRKRVFERDGYICAYDGVPVIDDKGAGDFSAEADHVLPYSLGGDDSMDNLRTSCRRCNRKRGNKMEERAAWRNPELYPL